MYSDDDREFPHTAKRTAGVVGAGRPASHFSTSGAGFSDDDDAHYWQLDYNGNEMASAESDCEDRRSESRPKQATTTRRRKPAAKRAAALAVRRAPVSTKRPVSLAANHLDVSQARMAAMNPPRAIAAGPATDFIPVSRPEHDVDAGAMPDAEAGVAAGYGAEDQHYYGVDGADPPAGVPMAPMPVAVLASAVAKLRRLYPREPGKEYKCFACIHARGSVVNAVSSDRIKEIAEIVGGVPPACWVEVAVDVYNYYVREFLGELNSRLQEGELPFPEWHVQDIYDHYFTPEHNKADVQLSTHTRIIMFEKMLLSIYDTQTWTETTQPDGRVVEGIDTTNVDLMLRIGKYIDMMYARSVTGKSGIGSVAQTNLTRAPGVVGGMEQYSHPRDMSAGKRK